MHTSHLLHGLLLLAVVAVGMTTVTAQIKPLEFKEYDLDNGLHVILHEDHTAPVVATVVHYKVGSRDEDPARTGFAHFFEHLMFESTDQIERGTIGDIVNAAGGRLNAYTSNDETVYHFVMPSNEVRLPLWIEAQRMRGLKISELGVETQRGVVKEERNNRYDNAPYGGWHEKINAGIFANSPYAWSPIGSAQHIDSATIEEFQEFYDSFYQPSNAVLVVSGDFDEEVVRETIDAYFGGFDAAPEPRRPTVADMAPFKGEKRDTIYDDKAQLPALFIGYRGVDLKQQDAYAAELLSTILSRGESSRMYRSIVDEQQLAVQVSVSHRPMQYVGAAYVIAIVAPGKELGAVGDAIDAELDRLIKDGITDAELEKAKNIAESQFVGSRQGMHTKALQLASYYRYYGNTELINNELEHYLSVTKKDIQRVAKMLFGSKDRVVLTYIPKKG